LPLSGEPAGDDAGGRLGAAAGGAVVPEAGGGPPWLERVVWLVPLPEELLAEGELSQAASERASTAAAISHFPFIGRLSVRFTFLATGGDVSNAPPFANRGGAW
jgi:hypothetical protein